MAEMGKLGIVQLGMLHWIKKMI